MQTLTIITMAPEQTQGDASATLKLIHALVDSNSDLNNTIKINWILGADKADSSKEFYYGFINEATNREVAVIYVDLKGGVLPALESVIAQTDLFLLFSAYTPTTEINDLIQKHSKQMLTMGEYDCDGSFGTAYSLVATGFGKNKLGIFTDNMPVKCEDLHAQTKMDEMLLACLALNQDGDCITTDSIESYKNKKDLYFGYFNITGRQLGETDPVSFMLICVDLTMRKTQHDIDLVVRLKNGTEISSFADKIARNYPNQFNAIDYIDQTGNRQTISLCGDLALATGGRRIRVLNLFPMSPSLFKFLLHISQPFKALTGNESFVEGLAANAIIYYQIMGWKFQLFENFNTLCNKYTGDNSKISKYYAYYRGSSFSFIANIVDFILENEVVLQEQTKTMWALLQQNHNLIANLVPLLRAAILNPERVKDIFPNTRTSERESYSRVEQIKAVAPDLPILLGVQDMKEKGYLRAVASVEPVEKIELSDEQILNLIFKKSFRLIVSLSTETPNIPDCYAVELFANDGGFCCPYGHSNLIGYIPKQFITANKVDIGEAAKVRETLRYFG